MSSGSGGMSSGSGGMGSVIGGSGSTASSSGGSGGAGSCTGPFCASGSGTGGGGMGSGGGGGIGMGGGSASTGGMSKYSLIRNTKNCIYIVYFNMAIYRNSFSRKKVHYYCMMLFYKIKITSIHV